MKSYILVLMLILSACGKAPDNTPIAKITNPNTAQMCGEFFSLNNGSVQMLVNTTWTTVPNGSYENNGCSYTVLDGRLSPSS